ncbi:MAG TPA: hypothetical protein V6C86_00595 [Oculatellaceae cyanobacterium]|jgi:hypothetical protein
MNRLERFADSSNVSPTDSSATLFADYQMASMSNDSRVHAQQGTFDPATMTNLEIYQEGQKIGQELADGKNVDSTVQYNADVTAIQALSDPKQRGQALSSLIQGMAQADPTDVQLTVTAPDTFNFNVDFKTEVYINNSLDILSASPLKPSAAAASLTSALLQADTEARSANAPAGSVPIDHAVYIADFNRRRAQDSRLQDYVACVNKDGGISILYLGMNDVAPPDMNSKK